MLGIARRAAAGGCAALALTAGPASVAADPGAAVNTTCSYSQVVSAMSDQSPGIAEQFYATPAAQAWLQNFLAAPPPQRQQLVEQAQNTPGAPEHVALSGPLANDCDNY
ncbi:hypothetical protein MTER_09540 [Mycolicibacter terrae]|jgi:hemophore-related protein|uniref:Hemophore-related protein n=1 Tax=Mycolicibacter terrae TaxID=1788 RepID=A0AAD1HW14_9MYCO|nr:hemophore-related protein [Mycolicibacter terrae]ORW95658.1 hypothetical protein AWC28_00620 [Mycolicibacter terrae]BBX21543.1 hypothetical protein MTER_09540 [Mycolicibacter terrae]SNV88109.1 low molecular weight T-cell antigen [Mycolicibacter terrae]